MKCFAVFNTKARLGVDGRKSSLAIVKKTFTSEDKVIWMHAASLGEYEQGLPVLERLKQKYPDSKILVSFFSPSGLEHVKKKKHIADALCYLPYDRKSEVSEFCQQFQIQLFFTVKYDYWYRLFEVLKQKKAPIYVVSALFYEKQVFFKPFGSFFVNRLRKDVDCFFHQTQHSVDLAKSVGLQQSILAGDTRFARVKSNVEHFSELAYISDFIKEREVLVVGSSWESEEKIVRLLQVQQNKVKIILAPHDLKRIPGMLKIFSNHCLYSELKQNPSLGENKDLLIIDNIGMLSKLYHYADVALVGGGFHSAGLHNILEAAAFGVPVVIGNKYRKNPEADELIRVKGGFSCSTEEEAASFIHQLFQDKASRTQYAKNAHDFIYNQENAVDIIMQNIN